MRYHPKRDRASLRLGDAIFREGNLTRYRTQILQKPPGIFRFSCVWRWRVDFRGYCEFSAQFGHTCVAGNRMAEGRSKIAGQIGRKNPLSKK
jgi:hypothetical protein